MSFLDNDDVKERVRSATDIVDLVGSYLELRRQGRGYVALCPWHDDTKPSLQINSERQSWKCYVCDVGGDIFSFVQQREGIGFREALEMLAERAGIELSRGRRQPATEPGDPNDKPTLYRAAAWAEEQFHQTLLNSQGAQIARDYLESRGIDHESVVRHRIGFAPPGWDFLKRLGPSNGFSHPVLEAIDLLVRSPERKDHFYDRFRGRLMFPIRDIESRPIAFGGRVLPGLDDGNMGKYLNSSETRLFSKSENLYALDLVRDAVRKHHHLAIVEGYTDVVAAMQAGVDNVVAVLGTALGERHLKLMRRLFAERLTLVLDGDEAGQNRANQLLELFVAHQIDVRVATLPEGLDPADYVEKHGADGFREMLDAAPDALEHKIRRVTEGLDPQRDLHRSHTALEDILRLIAAAPTGTDESGASRLRRQQVLSRLARDFQLTEDQLRVRLGEMRNSGRRVSFEQRKAQAAQVEKREPLSPRDSELIQILIQNPTLVPMSRQVVTVNDLESESARMIYQTMLTLSQADAEPDFHRLMDAFEDPQIKSLLVELDELATQKAELTSDSAEARLNQLLERLHARRTWTENQLRISEMENKQVDETEELSVLQQCLELQRKRQGIADPTDG